MTMSGSRNRCEASSTLIGTPSGRWSSPSLSSAMPCMTRWRVAGRAEFLIDLVRRWEEFLVDGYDTFGECWGWGTPVHGWSSTPTRDLVWYVLGITPAEPGYRRVRVAPRLGRLREAAGAVPTPHGLVEVRVAGSEAEIDSPVPAVVVHENGTETELAAGQQRATIR